MTRKRRKTDEKKERQTKKKQRGLQERPDQEEPARKQEKQQENASPQPPFVAATHLNRRDGKTKTICQRDEHNHTNCAAATDR